MRPMIVPMLAAVLITATTCALAPAQVAKSWPYRNGEFLDEGNGNWVERQNGTVVYRFREVSRGDATADLFDGSRGIRVILKSGVAEVKQDGNVVLRIAGGWYWREWKVGTRDVRFVHTGGTSWTEYQSGRPAFFFQATGRSNDGLVTLYDNTRGIRVELTRTNARVLEDGRVIMTYAGSYLR